ncbi:Alpha/beta hydrolase [Edwardsiella anguillarum]|nr:Alpha/beta hydrolase [Edwardsiella anguillarum]BET85192.1 Alpha/beta hydrolase [Edwardsiella anguillarum]BET88555.1 Alpha/beta hydrolase [Edwardsiella anguillarum]BET91846.1 Alpha/beta hydrolase [Edwardsiella anguillarum]GAJ67299.1 hypothetical protein MA13_contig00005-0079 [Edwardsiella piscicida]
MDNKIKDMSILLSSFIVPCLALILGLSAVPQELVCVHNGYFCGLTLREDLPGRFFTMLTP